MRVSRTISRLAWSAALLGLPIVHARAQTTRPRAPSDTVPPSRTAAQDSIAAVTGRQLTNAEIAAAIRRSGLSEDQVRERVRAAGYDGNLLDPFYGRADQTSDSTDVVDASFVAALQQMGVVQGLDASMLRRMADTSASRDSLTRPGRSTSLVFGKSIFGRTNQFDPVGGGPVDPSYRVGSGDQLQVILTGGVEHAYAIDVRRDGTVVLPQVGQLMVGGLTLEAVRSLMTARAAAVYSGLDVGRTHLDVSIGRVRAIEVFVVGEVERPGSYQLSALGTMFQALARAGGPTESGSFRDVELRRGTRVIGRFDLYGYLLQGDATADTHLEQGDVMFVPPNMRSITFKGAVRRPGIYELKSSEHFSDLLRFAGGLLPNAAFDRIQIDRILPPGERGPGRDRVVVDVRTHGDLSSLDTLHILEKDVITAFSIGDLRRNAVQLDGEVFVPGRYQWKPGMTVASLVAAAQGAKPWGLTDRVKVVRAIPMTGRSKIYSINMSDSASARFLVQEFDTVRVLDGRLENPRGAIQIRGAVSRPGVLPFMEQFSLRDAVDLAGGFTELASRVEVARRVLVSGYTDTTSWIFRFPLGADRQLARDAAAFVLERGDEIAVRATPGSRDLGTVAMRGLFTYPGTYAIQRDDERLRELVARAGGILPTASRETFKVIRAGQTVALSYDSLANGDAGNITARDGDEVVIGRDPSVVYVSGAVERRVAVPFRLGWEVDEYLDAAGGVSPNGVRDKVIVEYASGSIARTKKSFLHRSDPPVRSGATITVLEKPPAKDGAWRDALVATSQVLSVIASLALGVAALRR